MRRAHRLIPLALLIACGNVKELELGDGSDTAQGGGTGSDAGAGPGGDGTDTPTGPVPRADKIDLLVMIDNSSSMADKQSVLASAVPELVSRLTNPRCVDSTTRAPVAAPVAPGAACPGGSVREFDPVKDLHVGVISSSLGGHGADTCSAALPNSFNLRQTDMGHLLATGTAGRVNPSESPSAFLSWSTSGDATDFTARFQDLVRGVDQTGCGFESQLESVYRFLADPAPYQSITLDNGAVVKNGTDSVLLDQRGAFLRPDSMLLVVSITDEDDCSVREDAGQNYYIVEQSAASKKAFRMFRSAGACRTNPDDKCCTSCALPAPDGCTPHDQDAECQINGGKLTDEEDALNLRCFDQKRKFGVDFLYGTQRYVDMLTRRTLDGGAANPIFAGGRDPRNVYWAMIVGVPWQDVARDRTDASKGLLPTTPLGAGDGSPSFADRGTWDLILGDPATRRPPTDPLMRASIDPRQGSWPPGNVPLVPPNGAPGTPPAVDPSLPNGHEWSITSRDDLQYACIFPLAAPRDCGNQVESCDCSTGPTTQNPLCQDPQTGEPTTTQYRAKAYPGTRHLAVAKGLGAQAIVGSICPANVADPNAADYGYRPVVDGILQRISGHLKGSL